VFSYEDSISMQALPDFMSQLIGFAIAIGVAKALVPSLWIGYGLRRVPVVLFMAIGLFCLLGNLLPVPTDSIKCSAIALGLILGYLPEWFATLRDGTIWIK
jgi:hypothetical protein